MGRRVELLERDGQTNKADVQRAAASLVASGCSAIVGLSDTDQVLAAAPIAARAGVPFVTSGATSPRLTKQVPNWLFLACFGDNAQAAASAQFATDQLGARTAAIVYDKDMDYTRLLAKYFERSFRAQGGNVVATADFKLPAQAVPQLEAAGDGVRDGIGAGDESTASESERRRVGGSSPEAASAHRDEYGHGDGHQHEARRPRVGRRALRGRRPGGRGAHRAPAARRRLPAADHGRRQLRLRVARPGRREDPAARSTTRPTPPSA